MSRNGRTPPVDRDWEDDFDDARSGPGRAVGGSALTGGGLTLTVVVVLGLIWIVPLMPLVRWMAKPDKS